jgi:hypothetical protein
MKPESQQAKLQQVPTEKTNNSATGGTVCACGNLGGLCHEHCCRDF